MTDLTAASDTKDWDATAESIRDLVKRVRAQRDNAIEERDKALEERDNAIEEKRAQLKLLQNSGILSFPPEERNEAATKIRKIVSAAEKKGGVDELLRSIWHTNQLRKSHYILQILGSVLLQPEDLIIARLDTNDATFTMVKVICEPDSDFPCAINVKVILENAEDRTFVVPVGPGQFQLLKPARIEEHLDKILCRANLLRIWKAEGGGSPEAFVDFAKRYWRSVKKAIIAKYPYKRGHLEMYEKKERSEDAKDTEVVPWVFKN